MWILLAFGSAVFAGLTSILAKCGIKKTDSGVATAVRTIVVLMFSWLMVFLNGSQTQLLQIDRRTWLFLVLSGLATGASWLCYFKALQLGNINQIVPIDKSSVILTILLAVLFLKEELNMQKAAGIVLIGIGTYLMIEKKKGEEEKDEERKHKKGNSKAGRESAGGIGFAFGSALFASLTSILGKVGILGVESNLGTAIRTAVVLLMAWLMVFVTGKQHTLKEIPRNEMGFICLSGLATGASWLCYFKALQDGLASVVVPIDKLSIVVTVVFSYVVFKERLSGRGVVGLFLIVVGTLGMVVG